MALKRFGGLILVTIRLTGEVALLLGLLAALVAAPAFAEDAAAGDWQFSLTPYLWALSLNGDVTVDGQKSDVDVDFDTLFDDLNFAAMLEGEARKGRWGMFGNLLYADLEDDQNGRLRNTRIGIDIKVDVDVVMASFGGYYRLGPWALGSGTADTEPRVTADLYAGGRYTDLDVDLKLKVGVDDRDRNRKKGNDKNWLDPIIGLRTLWQLPPRWTVSISGDIGGFGVGSDFQWQATGLIGYNVKLADTYDSQVYAGYRGLYQDYRDGNGDDKFKWDMTWHGPFLGWTINF